MIAIRVNGSKQSGLGHASRQRALANKFKKFGFKVLIILDNEDIFLRNFFNHFEVKSLYKSKEVFTSQDRDSSLFVSAIYKRLIKYIIVDDYRFGYKWEKKLRDLGYFLIVFDDLASRKHTCNILIDAKWVGSNTKDRYSGKLNKDCIKLLGPEYIIINDEKSIPDRKPKKFNILVSSGGMSNSELNLKIAMKIFAMFKNANIKISLLRPQKNSKLIEHIKHKDLIFLDHSTDFKETLNSTDLYIGAAGQTLFEFLYRGIPSISFSLSENQNNNIDDFSDLGHYFHFNEKNIYNKIFFYTFIYEVIQHKDRMSALYKKNFYATSPHVNKLTFKILFDILKEKGIPKLQSLNSNYPQGKVYKISCIDDSHINSYLKARNSSVNMINMPGKKINRIKHYLWWLNTKRESFYLEKNGVKVLYIWHSYHAKFKVLYGGWFVIDSKINTIDVMYALNWQLNHTDRLYNGVPWVAVIKKENNFVNTLNKKFKFVLMKNGKYLKYTKAIFPSAEFKFFNFYLRLP